MFLLAPEKVIIYRSQGEKTLDDFLYSGGMFEEGFVTKYIVTDLLLFFAVVAAVLIGYSCLPSKRRRF